MQLLREALMEADQDRVAIGHFNISDLAALKVIAEAGRQLRVPVVIGLSEGERRFVGTREAAALVKSIRDEYSQRIYLNADHTHSLQSALEAARAGFDSVVFDRSELPFEQNIRETKEAVKALKEISPNIVVEGEIGDIGTGSKIHANALEKLVLTTIDEATEFVQLTKVDVLSPAVGNMHGLAKSMLAGESEKRLHIDLIRDIKQATGTFLTLHGASGTNKGDLEKAIEAGINIVHVNTDIRVAWRKGIEAALTANPDEVVPYVLLSSAVDAIRDLALARLQIFSSHRSPA